MYRWRFVNENIQDIFPKDILPGDHFLHLLHAQIGQIGFIDDTMAVYRRHAGGIWWDRTFDLEKSYLQHGIEEIGFYNAVYKYITPEPDRYFTAVLIHVFNFLLNIYVKHECRHEIEIICAKFPNLFTGVFFDKLQQITDMSKQIDDMSRQIADLSFEKQQQIHEIQALGDEMQVRNHEVQALNHEIETRNHKIQTLGDELQTRDHEIQTLNNVIENRNQEIQAIKHSVSYRLSKKLMRNKVFRVLYRMIKRIVKL
jgi:hypothetical protein